jgi:hypothetical protein
MPSPRPYGRGPYGTGPYSRYGGTLYEVGGATEVVFGARALGVNRVVLPAALSQIAWDVWTEHLMPTWAEPDPCSTGTWAPRRLVG